MPAQGRGAFLTPRAPAPRRTVQQPPPGLAQVVHRAVAQAVQATHPGVVAAQHVVPAAVHQLTAHPAPVRGGLTEAVDRAVGGARKATHPAVAAVQQALRRDPLLRYHLESQLEVQKLQQRAQLQQILQQQQEQQKAHAEGKGGALDLGFVNLTPALTTVATAAQKLGVGQFLANALAPGAAGLAGGLAGKVINEGFDLPGQAILAGADATGAAYKAGEALGSGGRKGSYAPGEELLGGIAHQITHPLKSAEEAPLATALLFGGLEGGIGGAVGRVGRLGEEVATGADVAAGRAARVGEVLKPGLVPAFSQARPDLKLYGDLAKQQRYNPDPLRKGAQVAAENFRGRGGADPFQATGRLLHRELVGGIVKPGRVDRMRQAGERSRRQRVNTVKSTALHVAPEHGRDAVPLFYQGILRTPATAVADLQKERAKLEAAVQGDHGLLPTQVKENRDNLARVEGLLNDPKFLADMGPAYQASEALKALSRPAEATLIHGGVLKTDAVRAKHFPYAQAHMGGEYAEEINPHAQLRYDASKAEHAAATERVSNAQGRVAMEENALARLKTKHAADRATQMRVSKGAIRSIPGQAEEKAARILKLRDAKQGLREAQQAERAAHDAIPEKPVPVPGMRKPGGGLLTDQEIIDHMRANGVHDVGFMSHQPGTDSAASFYQATTRLPGVYRHHRTGTAFEKGVAPQGWEHLVGSIARKASDAAQLEIRARELSHLTLHPPEGGFESKAAADAFARNAGYTPAGEPLPNGLGDLKSIHLGAKEIQGVNPRDLQETLERFGLHNEKSLLSEQNGRYGLIPVEVEKRLLAHDKAIEAHSNIARGAQAYQNAFRAAKLNTSTRHIFGVAAEQAIRLGAEGVLPGVRIPEELRLPKGKSVSTGALAGKAIGGRAARAGIKLDNALKAAAQTDEHGLLLDHAGPLGAPIRELEAQLGTGGGGQVQGYKDLRAMRAAQRWSDTSRTARVAKAGEAALHDTLPGKAALKTWHGWSHIVEGSLKQLEHSTRYALVGKALKDTGFISKYRDVLKAQDQAMHDMVTKGLSPNQADHVARLVDDMMGNWTNLTPDVRKAVAYVTPFGLWWLNSMRWLYRLPVTHPIKTGILAAVYSATRQARNAEGQGYNAPSPVPDWLQGTIGVNIPGLGKGHINPAYYSPGGVGGPDFWKTAIEQIAPQLAGPVYAGLGLNPLSLKELKNSQGGALGPGQKALNILSEIISGPVPGTSQLQSGLQAGGKPYGTANLLTDLLDKLGGPAQIKPGTGRPFAQNLEKMLLPERFAYDTGAVAGARPAAGAGGSPLTPTEEHRLERAGGGTGLTPSEEARLKRAEEALGSR